MKKKGRFFRNQHYLEYVSCHISCLDWATENYPESTGFVCTSVCHHVRTGNHGGMGLKPSDYRCVPLRGEEHAKLHNHGEDSFWAEAKVSPDEIIISLLINYVRKSALAAEVVLKHVGDTQGQIEALEDLIEAER